MTRTLIGYARVSTQDQKLDSQLDALSKAGCVRTFADTASGARSSRPELDRCLEYLRDGDVLVVTKLDRLGRSLRHLLDVIDDLKERGIGFQSLADGIDTTTSTGRLLFSVMASFAEFERDLIRERTVAGLQSARARGRVGGRPRAITAEIAGQVDEYRTQGRSAALIAEQLGLGRATVYRYLSASGLRTRTGSPGPYSGL